MPSSGEPESPVEQTEGHEDGKAADVERGGGHHEEEEAPLRLCGRFVSRGGLQRFWAAQSTGPSLRIALEIAERSDAPGGGTMVEEVSRKVVAELRCVRRQQTIAPDRTAPQALRDESIAKAGLGRAGCVRRVQRRFPAWSSWNSVSMNVE